MNIVYMAFTASKDWLKLAEILIKSLIENTSVDRIFAGIVIEDTGYDAIGYKISSLGWKVHPFRIAKNKWENNRMAYKIELLETIPFQNGDCVFVLDVDLYVKKDIFECFDSNPDVILTVRPEFFLSVNQGVFGFRNSGQGKVFLKFYIEQMKNSTWCEFKKFRIKNARGDNPNNRDWRIAQDFLCTVNDSGLPFSCNIKKLNCRTYNCTPAKKRLEVCFNNPDKSIIHFKGPLKPYWLAYYSKIRE